MGCIIDRRFTGQFDVPDWSPHPDTCSSCPETQSSRRARVPQRPFRPTQFRVVRRKASAPRVYEIRRPPPPCGSRFTCVRCRMGSGLLLTDTSQCTSAGKPASTTIPPPMPTQNTLPIRRPPPSPTSQFDPASIIHPGPSPPGTNQHRRRLPPHSRPSPMGGRRGFGG